MIYGLNKDFKAKVAGSSPSTKKLEKEILKAEALKNIFYKSKRSYLMSTIELI